MAARVEVNAHKDNVGDNMSQADLSSFRVNAKGSDDLRARLRILGKSKLQKNLRQLRAAYLHRLQVIVVLDMQVDELAQGSEF